MKNLLYKEFRLVVTPIYFLTLLFGVLLLIPQWLYFIAMMYILFIAIPNISTAAKAQNDTGFTVMLPVRKRGIVKARILSIAMLQTLQVIVGAVFAALNILIYAQGNFMLDTNIAFLGCTFIMYGVFNVIFFPMYYKTANKVGLPSIIAIIAAVLFSMVIETLALRVPAVAHILDGITTEALVRQVPVLAAGIIIFVLLTMLACKKSAKSFERIDL